MMASSSTHPPEPLFVAIFSEAYSLRNMFSLVKQSISQINIVWSPDMISFVEVNDNKTIMYEVTIKKSELKDYRYNLCDNDGNIIPSIATGVDISDMVKATRSLKRNDGAIIFLMPGNQILQMQLIRAKAKDGSRTTTNFIPIKEVENNGYEAIKYDRSYDEPNTKVVASDFSTTCTTIVSMRCSNVEIIGYPRGITFKGIRTDRSVASIERFGFSNEGDDIINKIGIPISTVKALGKINNLSVNGAMLKFYIEHDKPLKIISPIGTYGILSVLLRNIPSAS